LINRSKSKYFTRKTQQILKCRATCDRSSSRIDCKNINRWGWRYFFSI